MCRLFEKLHAAANVAADVDDCCELAVPRAIQPLKLLFREEPRVSSVPVGAVDYC